MAPASSLMGSGFRRGAGGGLNNVSSGLGAGTGIGICAAEAAASLRAPAGAPPSAFEALAAALSASSRSSDTAGSLFSSHSRQNPSSRSPPSSIKMIPLLDFEVGAAALPHPEKVQRDGSKAVCRLKSGHAGEDAYFSEELPQNRGVSLLSSFFFSSPEAGAVATRNEKKNSPLFPPLSR